MLYATIRISNMPLLRSSENFMEPVDYKHFVPPGLADMVRKFAQKTKIWTFVPQREKLATAECRIEQKRKHKGPNL